MFSLDKTLLKKWLHKNFQMQAKKGEEGGRGKPL
ncbi:MAG: hypothetical protein METHSR3v1_1660002 [Methanothrix sp.]|jgi:hypothetical protein|nr:MAG: hypothetical protein METHSR3v1_1660002 [Methanothrix sp.]